MVVSGIRGVCRSRERLLGQLWRDRRLDPTALAPASARKRSVSRTTAARAWAHPVPLSRGKSSLAKGVVELVDSRVRAAVADRLTFEGTQSGIGSSRLRTTGNGYRGTGRS
ncbi:hypothetical protein ACFOSC_30910 [Streptantibioticus rubrisoli]|uniref:Uncharacterized protein n=1 Tax=Streptantibioticus rubrisoli TaxID=1387313 RepID=A0ABT1PIT1_9ACTN|nr:hypothetical protein [Streptantibioticus rubrisoli]MCQ4045280.1 hypothetical protein [Streptantibioticus rubrisoli]